MPRRRVKQLSHGVVRKVGEAEFIIVNDGMTV